MTPFRGRMGMSTQLRYNVRVLTTEIFMPQWYNFTLLICMYSSLLLSVTKLQFHQEKRIYMLAKVNFKLQNIMSFYVYP